MSSVFADLKEPKKNHVPEDKRDELREYCSGRLDTQGTPDSIKEVSEKFGIKPFTVLKFIDKNVDYVDHYLKHNGHTFKLYTHESVLHQLLFEENMDCDEIAEELDCAKSTVQTWMDKFDIDWKTKNKQVWKGTRNWERVAREVRERDNFQCRICGLGNDEHIEKYDKSLNVHHVIAQSAFETSELAADKQNLVTLCQRCHQSHEAYTPREMFLEAFC